MSQIGADSWPDDGGPGTWSRATQVWATDDALVTRRERRVYIHQAFLIIANLMSCLS